MPRARDVHARNYGGHSVLLHSGSGAKLSFLIFSVDSFDDVRVIPHKVAPPVLLEGIRTETSMCVDCLGVLSFGFWSVVWFRHEVVYCIAAVRGLEHDFAFCRRPACRRSA
jgi:hypothetical protein